MKLNKNYIVHNTGRESVLVPAGGAYFSGMVRGNETLGRMLELLENETTEAEMLKAIMKEYDADEEIVREDIEKLISELKIIGAIDQAGKAI